MARRGALLVALLCAAPLPLTALGLAPLAWLGPGSDPTTLFTAIAGGHLAGVVLAAALLLSVRPARVLLLGLAAEGAALIAACLLGPVHGLIALGAASGSTALAAIGGYGVFPALAGGSVQRSLTLLLACQTGMNTCVPLIAGPILAATRQDPRLQLTLFLALFAIMGAAALAAALAVPWLSRAPAAEAASAAGEAAAAKAPPGSSAGWFLAVAIALIGMHGGIDNTIAQWAPTFIQRAFADPAFPPAWIITFTSGGVCVGRLLLARYASRAEIGRLFVQRPPLVGAALIALACLSPSSLAAAAGLALGCLSYGLEYPAILALLGRHAPARLSTAIALGSVLGDLAWMGLTHAVGTTADAHGIRIGFALAPIGLLALSLGAVLLLRPPVRAPCLVAGGASVPASAA